VCVALVLAAHAVARGAAAQGAFEVGGSLGLDKAETDGGSSAQHPCPGAWIEYSYTNRALDAGSGPVGRLRFSWLHGTSDGGVYTSGKVGLDDWQMPAVSVGWRTKRLEVGLTADYRAEAFFLDSTTSQAFEARHAPGHMRAQFVGPYVALGLGALGTSLEKVAVDACYQRGRGFRYAVFDYQGNVRDPEDVQLDGAHSLHARLSYAASPHVAVRAEYQSSVYPTEVARNAGVDRPFDVRHNAMFVSIAVRQR